MNFFRSAAVHAMAAGCMVAAAQNTAPEPMQPAESTAQLIGVASEINQLRSLAGSAAPADRWQILWLHQHIYE